MKCMFSTQNCTYANVISLNFPGIVDFPMNYKFISFIIRIDIIFPKTIKAKDDELKYMAVV
jgi:predicted small integral membrane protein